MSLTHTIKEFDKAIRKVRSDYANVSECNVTASDIVSGKVAMNSNKELITGTLENANVSVSSNIIGDVIGDTETNYPVKITPNATVTRAGFIRSGSSGDSQTRYIKVQEKQVTPTTYEQTITPSSGHLLSKVTIAPASVPPVIENMRVGRVKFTRPTLRTSSSSNIPYCSSGNTHNNVYCYSGGVSKAKVYLYYLGTSLSDTMYFDVIDPSTKQIPSTTLVLTPGDSVTCTAHSYGPGGILTLTTEGRITFQHTSTFYCSTTSTMIILLINGKYYTIAVDYKVFSHSYNGVGGFTSTSSGITGGNFQIVQGTTKVTYYKPVTLFANITPIYFYAYYHSSTSKEPLRMTFNYGTYYGFFREQEEDS
jgi:hypothetical protein